MTEPIRTLVAEPPWAFRDGLPGGGRGAYKHYPLLNLHEVMRFPLPDLAPDCRLFLWVPASLMPLGLKVVEAWGFKYTSEGVWVKVNRQNGLGGPGLRIGMGRTFRMTHEPFLVGYRGRPARLSSAIPSVLIAPHQPRHSQKPDEFYDMVERLSPGPYAELFARRERPGWECYGNELAIAAPTVSRDQEDAASGD